MCSCNYEPDDTDLADADLAEYEQQTAYEAAVAELGRQAATAGAPRITPNDIRRTLREIPGFLPVDYELRTREEDC